VRDVAELLEIVPLAFTLAESDRPGPVLIDVPKDVQTASIAIAEDALPVPGGRTASSTCPDALIDELVTLLAFSRRPVIYLGGGVIASNASSQARELARRLAAPVVCTLNALGSIPADDPHFMGMLGMHGTRATHMILDEADVLLAIGARFDDRATGKAAEFCPRATIAHIDIDRAEIGKIKTPFLGLRVMPPTSSVVCSRGFQKTEIAPLRLLAPLGLPVPQPYMPPILCTIQHRRRSLCILSTSAASSPKRSPPTLSLPPTLASTRCGLHRRGPFVNRALS